MLLIIYPQYLTKIFLCNVLMQFLYIFFMCFVLFLELQLVHDQYMHRLLQIHLEQIEALHFLGRNVTANLFVEHYGHWRHELRIWTRFYLRYEFNDVLLEDALKHMFPSATEDFIAEMAAKLGYQPSDRVNTIPVPQ